MSRLLAFVMLAASFSLSKVNFSAFSTVNSFTLHPSVRFATYIVKRSDPPKKIANESSGVMTTVLRTS